VQLGGLLRKPARRIGALAEVVFEVALLQPPILIELDELAPRSHRPGGHAAEYGMSSGVPDGIARSSILKPPAEQRGYTFRRQIALVRIEGELGWQAPGPKE